MFCLYTGNPPIGHKNILWYILFYLKQTELTGLDASISLSLPKRLLLSIIVATTRVGFLEDSMQEVQGG